jgi:ribosome maturation factor RimP
MGSTERVRALAAPIAAEAGAELVDVEFAGGILRVTIDRDGGVGLDVITAVTRDLSRALDEADPIPGRYTLEVSSPGLERPLRTPDVVVKTRTDVDGARRVAGTLVAADDRAVTVRDPDTLEERTIAHEEIERARTTFAWGPTPKPGAGNRNRKAARS